MDSNLFFKKNKYKVKKLFPKIKINQDFYIDSVKPLHLANKKDITFFDTIKYKHEALSTQGGLCITTEKLKKYLPSNLPILVVKNVLYELAIVLKKIYPYTHLLNVFVKLYIKSNLNSIDLIFRQTLKSKNQRISAISILSL